MPEFARCPLLMTATIAPKPQPGLTLDNPLVRWAQYRKSIIFWLSQPLVDLVIFAENSQFPVDYGPLLELAHRMKKSLEIIPVPPTNRPGKALGETHIMRHVLATTPLIRHARSFYKVTGRIQVRNFSRIARHLNTTPTAFARRHYRTPQWADTRFFKVDPEFLAKVCLPLPIENSHAILGQIYGPTLHLHKIPSLWPYPQYAGCSAGTGQTYHIPRWKSVVKTALAIAGGFDL